MAKKNTTSVRPPVGKPSTPARPVAATPKQHQFAQSNKGRLAMGLAPKRN